MSGGADSTALLLGLHRLASELGLELAAAHLHHGLRGREADADRRFVRALCARLQVPLVSARWDTRARMRRLGWSGQEGLRRLRRRFLLQAASRVGAPFIATAHTADDQVETLLMRLARGTGLSGLGATRPRRGRWIRPLLEATRADVVADLRAIGHRWREDRSNADLHYERNRIRHRVIPVWLGARDLESRGALARRIASTLRDAREARAILDRSAIRALRLATRSARPGARSLDRRRLAKLPDVILRLALRRAWKSIGVPRGLTAPALDDFVTLVRGSGPGSLDLPGGWSARRDGEAIRIEDRASGIERVDPAAHVCHLRVPGRNKLGDLELRASWVAGTSARDSRIDAGEAFFAASQLKGRLELRFGRTDEWFVPSGRLRARRLGDFLKQTGIPRPDRRGPMVLADRQGILWVVGLRRSARASLTPGTRKALWVRART